MSALFTRCQGYTVQTRTGKVDPARKFKCTRAVRGICVILSDLLFKEGHPWFTTVPFNPLTDRRGQRCICLLNVFWKDVNLGCTLAYCMNTDDVRFISGKSKLFYVQRGFQKCKYLCSAISRNWTFIFFKFIKQLARNTKHFCKYERLKGFRCESSCPSSNGGTLGHWSTPFT